MQWLTDYILAYLFQSLAILFWKPWSFLKPCFLCTCIPVTAPQLNPCADYNITYPQIYGSPGATNYWTRNWEVYTYFSTQFLRMTTKQFIFVQCLRKEMAWAESLVWFSTVFPGAQLWSSICLSVRGMRGGFDNSCVKSTSMTEGWGPEICFSHKRTQRTPSESSGWTLHAVCCAAQEAHFPSDKGRSQQAKEISVSSKFKDYPCML